MNAPVSPDVRTVWRAARGPAAILLVIIAASVVIALVHGTGTGEGLDPRSVTPGGSRALARLLENEGVRIELAHTSEQARTALAADGPATLLVTRPEWVAPERIAGLRGIAAHLVLITPPPDLLTDLGLPVRADGGTEVVTRTPDCRYDRAGPATMGGDQYTGSAELCYDRSLARMPGVTLLGTGLPLTNDLLDEQGNAALAMRLLGEHELLVWYVPTLDDAAALPEQRPLADLLPAGWKFGLVQLAIAVAVVALWRARRLGPVVSEPLPVTVRAAETVEGRARLYRRVGAAGHAATALRQATRDRLVRRLGLPRDAPAEAVASAAADRTGRPGPAVHDLLYGPPPTGEAGLVGLADALDALENEVNHR